MVDLAALLALTALGAGGAGILKLVASINRAETLRREELWTEAARRLNGQFTPTGGSMFQRRSMAIDAQIGGVHVRVDHYTVSNGKSSTTYTRVAALTEGPPGLTLRIYEEGLLSTLGKKLGMQDVVVGDAEFDDLFVVKASDEDLARAWLVSSVTQPLSRLPSWSHRLEGGTVTSMTLGIVEDVDELKRAALAVARLAGRGAALRADWDHLAQDLGGVLTGELWRVAEPAISLGGSGSPVRIEIAHAALPAGRTRREGLVTRVCADRSGGAQEPFVATPEAVAPGVAIGTETQVAILFEGLMFDAERLRTAVGIARQLATGHSSGPYR